MTELSASISKRTRWALLVSCLLSGSVIGQTLAAFVPRTYQITDPLRLATAKDQYQAATEADSPASKIEALLWLASFHEQYGGTVRARLSLQQALVVARQTGNFGQQISIYYRLGNVLQQENRHKEALQYYQKALTNSQALRDLSSVTLAQYYIGQSLLRDQQYDSAMHYLSEAQKSTLQTGDRAGWVVSTLAIGQAYQQQQRPTDALSSLQSALPVATDTEVKDTTTILSIYQALGEAYRTLNQPKLGLKYTLRGLEIASTTRTTRWLSQRVALMRLVAALKADQAAYAQAYSYLSASGSLRDSLQQYRRQRQIKYLQAWRQIEQTGTLEVMKAKVQWQHTEAQQWDQARGLIGTVNAAVLLLLIAGCAGYRSHARRSVPRPITKEAVLPAKQENRQQRLRNLQIELDYKSQLLQTVKEKLEADKALSNISSKTISQIHKLVIGSIDLDQEWSTMQLHFASLPPPLFEQLQTQFPQLSQNDLRLCAYIRLQLDHRKIAKIMRISSASVQTARYRLKKKMQLPAEVNLTYFVSQF